MKRPPLRNLPPASEAWGRFVEDEINVLGRDSTQNRQTAANGLSATNSALQQLSGQVSALANVVNALPVSNMLTSSVSNFQAGNGTQTRTTVTFAVPEGKTRCSIMASMQGFYIGDFSVPNSDRAGFRIVASGGYVGPFGSMSPDNMDSYWISGNGGVQLNSLGSTVSVSIQSVAGPTLAPAYPDNNLHLFALAIFS